MLKKKKMKTKLGMLMIFIGSLLLSSSLFAGGIKVTNNSKYPIWFGALKVYCDLGVGDAWLSKASGTGSQRIDPKESDYASWGTCGVITTSTSREFSRLRIAGYPSFVIKVKVGEKFEVREIYISEANADYNIEINKNEKLYINVKAILTTRNRKVGERQIGRKGTGAPLMEPIYADVKEADSVTVTITSN